jgi:hypothetical protein
VTPDAAATVVWLDERPADAQSAAALTVWARSHGMRLVPPTDEARTTLTVDLGIAATVEDWLDSARDALTARSAADVDRALAAAESLLEAHPELPNAAWLMAEVERARAARFRRINPTDVEAAERAGSRAYALDGGRLAGAGETQATMPPTTTITLQMRGAREEQVWIDGSPASTLSVESRAGPHAIVVTWQGAPIWAKWIEALPGASTVALSDLDAPACSSADLESAHIVEGAHLEANLALCANWVGAAPGLTPGAIRVATCEADQCTPLADWHPAPLWSQPVQPERKHRSGWPAWATWGLVGTGVAVASGIVAAVVASSSRGAGQVEFLNGGLQGGPTTH